MATEPLPSFLCPISGEIMINPVFTVDGQTYERVEIEGWFRLGHDTSPSTGTELRNPNPKP